MFHSFSTSQEVIHTEVPSLEPGVLLVSSDHVDKDARLRWGVTCVDVLLKKFFTPSFPDQDVVWGLEAKDESNACVWGHLSPSVVLITSGAIRLISDTRAKLATPATTFARNYAFPVGTVPTSETARYIRAVSQAGENLGLFALAALFAHEVGHVHDRQFEHVPSIARNGRLDQSHEISADTWAIRACCELAVGWARELSERMQVPLELTLRSSLFYVLVGHGLIDQIDWKAKWQAPSTTGTGYPAHPPGAFRLLSGAVTMSEWLVERNVLDEKTSASIAIEVFGVSAQTLYWLQTGQVAPPVVFQHLAMIRLGNGAVVDELRDEYELFRAALSPVAL